MTTESDTKKKKYYISDLTLFRRIRSYVRESENPEKINKDSMVEDLRLKHKEYERRQKCAFRALVIRTYKVVLENINDEEEEILNQADVPELKKEENVNNNKTILSENTDSKEDSKCNSKADKNDNMKEKIENKVDKNYNKKENCESEEYKNSNKKEKSKDKNENNKEKSIDKIDNKKDKSENKEYKIDNKKDKSENKEDKIYNKEDKDNNKKDINSTEVSDEISEIEKNGATEESPDDSDENNSADSNENMLDSGVNVIDISDQIILDSTLDGGMEIENKSNGEEDEYDIYDMSENYDDLDVAEITQQPRVSYAQKLQKMTNSLKQKPEVTVISSDEEDPVNMYPNIFSRDGPVNIQRINVNKHRRSQSGSSNIPNNLKLFRINLNQNGHSRGNYPYRQKSKKREYDGDFPLPMPKRVKPTISTIPNVSFKLFGGFSKILQTVSELVVHVKESEIYKTLGVKPPRGFLLHGPPGCGKTLLAQAIAGELEVPLIRVAGPELIAGVSGESESRIRELFDSALIRAPCIMFIDEIDAICPPRDTARREMERRIVAQLLTCLDGLGETEAGDRVVIIGATNRPDALDPALRRAGRFDREVCLGIPDRNARKEILQVITDGMKLKPGLDFDSLSAATPGFVGADLKALSSEAAIAAVNRCLETEKKKIVSSINTESMDVDKEVNTTTNTTEVTETESSTNDENVPSDQKDEVEMKEGVAYLSLLKSNGPLLTTEQLSSLFIEMVDFEKALKTVQPSAKREGFATVPDVTWNDIGSLQDIRNELEKSIMMPVKYPNEFALLGINAPTGILLCGPPGCGKTLLAKAVANEANINFISVKGPELLNMYVGESERAVRQCFLRARNSQPCVIFFDEIDALCPKRGAAAEGNSATSRVVNQVLTEMDGVEGRTGVFLMAATNRPDMVDPAVLRPGRLDKILFVGLPTASDRSDILRALTKNGTKPPMRDINLDEIGANDRLEGYSGADLAALIKEASLLSLTEYIQNKDKNQLFVTSEMMYQACGKIRPSVPPEERLHYEGLRLLYGLPSSNNSSGETSIV